ncbi:type II toxin-antitoxin system VapC family toxin [Dyadobacter chenwenxiniae]|uniref:Type II toxin-antitoxin system VapC family toxin n=1 Tax=Dyadobacter chenwenxiniae TaxID=2906456 RepID=A0A9X1TED8_9BACT|nr:type II toxin-antitoxin system VapC family toxin [Dyadobacter chenwenxiniae]MCF0062906.1 type II toxin-antitoxin system VapC family toxin [Dyadobacter chenwenxiniae]UON84920.1 type II toxin-antitoxin system VapC family toxin [Dyadobacter chenwenxiniae]
MALNSVAIDTNVAIEALNGNSATIRTLERFDLIYLPVTVCGELLYGAKNSSRINYNLPRYQSFIFDCEVLDTQEPVANEYSSIKKHLRDIGCPIPENDIWIAAICTFYGIPLFTRDGHFEYIPALKRV